MLPLISQTCSCLFMTWSIRRKKKRQNNLKTCQRLWKMILVDHRPQSTSKINGIGHNTQHQKAFSLWTTQWRQSKGGMFVKLPAADVWVSNTSCTISTLTDSKKLHTSFKPGLETKVPNYKALWNRWMSQLKKKKWRCYVWYVTCVCVELTVSIPRFKQTF